MWSWLDPPDVRGRKRAPRAQPRPVGRTRWRLFWGIGCLMQLAAIVSVALWMARIA
jgi:hypothetical protein